MSISEDEKQALIEYRIEQAKYVIPDVELLLKNGSFPAAANRIYYGMFYMLLALAIKHDYSSSKHLQLLGWFNKEFIHPEKLDRKFGKMIRKAFDKRILGDYEAFVEFNATEIEEMLAELKEFIPALENLIYYN
jgi:uncharacterized protein (UPF0332 family)